MNIEYFQLLLSKAEQSFHDPFTQALLIGIALFSICAGYFFIGFRNWSDESASANAFNSARMVSPHRRRSAQTENLSRGLTGMKRLVGN